MVVVLALVSVLPALPAFAQQAVQVTITRGAGGGQSCVSAENCFDPSKTSVPAGTTVIWKNTDEVSHTVTSGSPNDNETGTVFDSSLLAPQKTFAFTFKDAGTFHYFCQVHPWMTGEVIVGPASGSAAPEFGEAVPAVLVASMITTVLATKLFRKVP